MIGIVFVSKTLANLHIITHICTYIRNYIYSAAIYCINVVWENFAAVKRFLSDLMMKNPLKKYVVDLDAYVFLEMAGMLAVYAFTKPFNPTLKLIALS